MAADYWAHARKRMVADLESRGLVRSMPVRQAFLTVPRDRFVAPALAAQSYLDDALPIGEGQTISKPSIVARMLEALEPAGQSVLEIGTGSGYATSLLSVMAREVFTIERIRSHSLRARRLVQNLGYLNVQYKTGDGGEGWPEMAPFTRILITAEADKLPQVLFAQLAEGGRMILPMKGRLIAVTRTPTGPATEDLGSAAFVPFITNA